MRKLAIPMCILGKNVRWDGKLCRNLIRDIENDEIFEFCPEYETGFSVPREPIEIIGGDGEDFWKGKANVITKSGNIIDDLVKDTSYKILERLKKNSVELFFSVKKSPMCALSIIYDGSFAKKVIKGKGVLTALFLINGLKVIEEIEC